MKPQLEILEDRTLPSFGPVTPFHYAPADNFAANGSYVPAVAGFNLAEVHSVEQLNALPAGVKALVAVPKTSGADSDFTNFVRPFVGNPKVFGYYLADEPNPAAVPADNLRAESDWIHANDPGKKTFIVLGAGPFLPWGQNYTPANTHVDLIGLDPYPVRSWGVDYNYIPLVVFTAELLGWSRDQIVPVYQTFGGTGSFVSPTTEQEQTMLAVWGLLTPRPAFDFAYSWGDWNPNVVAWVGIADRPDWQAVFSEHNANATSDLLELWRELWQTTLASHQQQVMGLLAAYHDAIFSEITKFRNFVISEKMAHYLPDVFPAAASATPIGLFPAQVRQAYGFDQIQFAGGIPGNGAGQTIAIVGAYHSPNLVSDLRTFDATFGLPAPPSLTVMNQRGGAVPPSVDPTGGWGLEASLDVQWAHAMAPAANIVVVEANSASFFDLFSAVATAAKVPGVSVVSMSWLGNESAFQSVFDAFMPPGITYVAASGDHGAGAGVGYPSASSRVLSVGGTNLGGQETVWAGSGGGLSRFTFEPAYQFSTQTTGVRTIPDVSYNAGTPYAIYDSAKGGWLQVRGTSAGAPQWAALIAIANQGRALAGLAPLDGASQTLPLLYQMPQRAFRDIVAGSNGFPALPGYDLATGRGSPIAYLVVAGLTSNAVLPAGVPPMPPLNVWEQLAELTAIPGQQFRALAFRSLALVDPKDFAGRAAAAQHELVWNPMYATDKGQQASALGWMAFAQSISY